MDNSIQDNQQNTINTPLEYPSLGNEDSTGQKNQKRLSVAVVIALLAIICGAFVGLLILLQKKHQEEPDKPTPQPGVAGEASDFYAEFLKQSYAQTGAENMMVSPYSMEAVWRLAEAGAVGDTKTEITNVFGERTMPSFAQLKSANGMFIRDSFADYVKEDYTNSFVGDLRYDSFTSPEPVNNWVSENTDGMIPKLLEETPSADLNILLLNAIVMDESWDEEFECDSTRGADFEYSDGTTEEVSMMSGGANKYFKTDNAEGVVREYSEYDDGSAFEFVGILPNGSVSDYMTSFGSDEIAAMEAGMIEDGSDNGNGGENIVSTWLPRFDFDYTVQDMIAIMKGVGVEQAFDEEKANFGAMVKLDELEEDKNIYVGSVIHKTRVELAEKGTKAAAVSAIGLKETTSAYEVPKDTHYEVRFTRPFVFLIRDKESKEIIFEGVVEQPEKWDDTNSCPIEE